MSTDITPSNNGEVVSASPNPTPPHKKISRRKALALAGTGTLVLVVGGGVWRAADQGVFSTGEGPAYESWDDWRTASREPLDLVRAAILTANPHNTQPWLFQVTPSQINLFADRMRTIGAIDPFLREMHIGLGCALENLLMAAAANGYTTQVSLLPDALDETWVACVDLAPGPTVIPDLYPLIPNRHTNRYPYDIGRSVTSATLDALSALNDDPEVRVFWFASAPLRKQVGGLLVEATHVSVSDTTQIGESDRWYRATWQDLQQYRDGITIDAAGLPDWKRALGNTKACVVRAGEWTR
jgi:hypothetical protein